MEENEMLEQTNETENVETQPTEEIEEQGIELTDTSEEVEQPAEQPTAPSKVEFTKEEQAKIDEIVQARLKRERREHERELFKRDNIIEKLKVGMGEESLENLDSKLTSYYEEQGIKMPSPKISKRDEEILAKADVEEIIESGIEEMERIANDIANKPVENRTGREKAMFSELVTRLTFEKAKSELSSKGVDTKILENEDFKTFASDFNATTPISKVYDLYTKVKKPEVTPTPKPIGSVKSNVTNNEIKEYYTMEEIKRFTKDDYLKNPKLMDAVENSLAKK